MSVCKGATGSSAALLGSTVGKENLSHPQQRFEFSEPSPSRRSASSGSSSSNDNSIGGDGDGGGGGGGGAKDSRVSAFDLMPPPMPRTPAAKECGARTAPVSPLQERDSNLQGTGDAASGGGLGRVRAEKPRAACGFTVRRFWRAVYLFVGGRGRGCGGEGRGVACSGGGGQGGRC